MNQRIVRLTPNRELMRTSSTGRVAAAASGFAHAPATAPPQAASLRQDVPLAFHIADRVNVIKVPADTSHEFRPENETDTMVLDGHAFGVAEAVEWTHRANEYARENHLRAPLITVIADENELTEHEYRLVTKRLADLGGLFFEYPEGVTTFDDAFTVYAKGVAGSYLRCVVGRRRSA